MTRWLLPSSTQDDDFFYYKTPSVTSAFVN